MTIKQETLTEQAREIVKAGLIKHIAFIMDGNRRWAKQKNLPKTTGHINGRQTFKSIVKHSSYLGLEYITTYAFSTENWGRDSQEVMFLMDLFVESLNKEIKELRDNNIRMKFIGRKDRLTSKMTTMMKNAETDTAQNTGLTLQVAIDYGSRYEITRALKDIILDVQNKKLSIDDIDENLFGSYLYTSGSPDPDLIIRTGGENRLSNYLLWQAAYSELYITKTYWPEFSTDELDRAIIDFSQRQRRWGKD